MSTASRGVVGTNHTEDVLPTGSRVEEFQVSGVIGAGRESIVYLARDRVRACDVALKEFLPSAIARRNSRGLLVTAAADAATFDLGRRRFLREAMELSRIQHPSLIRVHRALQHSGTAYVVMPLVSGRTLAQMCSTDYSAPTQSFLEGLLRPMLDLLAVLHRRHCVGLDLSGRHLMVLDDGRPLLMGIGQRDCSARGSEAHARPADPAWRDLRSLARTVLAAMAPGLEGGHYTPCFIKAISDAAHGEPADRPEDAQAWMAALSLPERRARMRLNRDFQRARQAADTGYLRVAESAQATL